MKNQQSLEKLIKFQILHTILFQLISVLFKKIDLQKKNNGIYKINNLGKLVISDIKNFDDSIEFLNISKEFFSSYDVEKLPNIFLGNIIQLKNSEFIKSNESNIYKAKEIFKKELLTP